MPWVPRLLGIHLGVALLALAATGSFLTPAVQLPRPRAARREAVLQPV